MLDRIMRTIAHLEGVRGAAVIGANSLVIEHAPADSELMGAHAALASDLWGVISMAGDKIGIGLPEGGVLSFTEGHLLMRRLTKDTALVVIASPKARLGMLQYDLNRYVEDIVKVL